MEISALNVPFFFLVTFYLLLHLNCYVSKIKSPVFDNSLLLRRRSSESNLFVLAFSSASIRGTIVWGAIFGVVCLNLVFQKKAAKDWKSVDLTSPLFHTMSYLESSSPTAHAGLTRRATNRWSREMRTLDTRVWSTSRSNALRLRTRKKLSCERVPVNQRTKVQSASFFFSKAKKTSWKLRFILLHLKES